MQCLNLWLIFTHSVNHSFINISASFFNVSLTIFWLNRQLYWLLWDFCASFFESYLSIFYQDSSIIFNINRLIFHLKTVQLPPKEWCRSRSIYNIYSFINQSIFQVNNLPVALGAPYRMHTVLRAKLKSYKELKKLSSKSQVQLKLNRFHCTKTERNFRQLLQQLCLLVK